MIQYDGIVFSLQQTGGISVLFKELIARLPDTSYRLVGFRENPPAELPHARYQFRTPRRLERYRRASLLAEADLFHSTYYRLPTTGRAKVVTTVYDFVYERYASLPKRFVHSTQKRRAIAGADCIICISESTRRDLVEFMGSQFEDRTFVVPLAASESYFPIPDQTQLSQVLFVGTRGGYKNFESVVVALSMLPELRLVCVGGGPLAADERGMVESLLPGRFRAAGYLSTQDLNREYNQSLCLVYPSRYEGFGIPVLEAMRAQCPVIAMRSSSIPEVAGTAAMLLERGTPEEISAAITQLARTESRQKLVADGLAQASKFTWSETFRQTLVLYERLLGRPLV